MPTSRRSGVLGGLIAVGGLIAGIFTAGPAQAQTTSVGPYYATPSWDQTLPTSTRFIILSNFASAAVLDRETGLVWEKAPSSTLRTWAGTSQALDSARAACIGAIIGGRSGWRLPSVAELQSVKDPSLPSPFVPTNVFTGVTGDYWSSTTVADIPTSAWVADFGTFGGFNVLPKTTPVRIWCVRGAMNADAY
jgi:hypothetical protein